MDKGTASTSASVSTVRALGDLLDGDTAEVRELARRFLVDNEVEALPGLDMATQRERVAAWLGPLAASGLLAIGLPADRGGQGNLEGIVAGFETLAHGNLSLLVKAGVQFGLFAGAIWHLGSNVHHDTYLADAMSVALPGCFAMTERGHGSDVAGLQTTATHDPTTGEFVLHTPDPTCDFKEWIGNAAVDGRMAATFAQLVVQGKPRGVHCLLVGLRNDQGQPLPGIRIEDCGHKMGLNGVDNGRIWFDHVRVPRMALLDRFASVSVEGNYTSSIESPDRRFFTMLGTLVQGRVSIAAGALGATKSALTIAVRHALRRTQFDRPDDTPVTLLEYPTHQRRLLIPLATTYALHFGQQRLASEFATAFGQDDLEVRRPLEAHAAGMKALATEHASATIQACREACGGLGYASDNQFTSLKADTDIFTTFEGDNTVLWLQVAKALLSGFRDEFGSMDLRTTVGFMTGRVIDTVMEVTSAHTMWQRLRDAIDRGEPGPDVGVRNREWQLGMLAWREDHVMASLARRMARAGAPDVDEFAVFLVCQTHMRTAARAHLDRRVIEAFADAVEEADDGVGKVLNRLCDLHALAVIEANRGWFQEHQRLSGARSKAVIATVDSLCRELTPLAGDLVDAFRIPDEVLAAPIAT